ncbi:unnamed protein product, partial [Vitis vinifera]
MYGFMLLLQYTTPSAILLGAIASLRGYAVSEASTLLFWQQVALSEVRNVSSGVSKCVLKLLVHWMNTGRKQSGGF